MGIFVAIAAVGLAMVALRGLRPFERDQDLAFDDHTWKANKNWDSDNPRGRMLDSLLAGNRLKGMARAQVIDLLGSPDGLGGRMPDNLTVAEEAALTSAQFDYIVGTSGLDYEFLAIHFDREGLVSRWEIWSS